MNYCAYDLDIDVDELRQELTSFQSKLEYIQQDWGSVFVDKNKIGEKTNSFYEMFPNCFLIQS